ncbi:hypothetical protein PoB_001296800 [Plakobranchus ocellatus]|uniref:Uncharacterized protein n=1 Tax=Plakobranchus ocellatus TaxID=259542 RepID=A0AAV3YV78_9GAST|nr:hypothetical protein PoB_001296800 [Plakobranchus ocellatus]
MPTMYPGFDLITACKRCSDIFNNFLDVARPNKLFHQLAEHDYTDRPSDKDRSTKFQSSRTHNFEVDSGLESINNVTEVEVSEVSTKMWRKRLRGKEKLSLLGKSRGQEQQNNNNSHNKNNNNDNNNNDNNNNNNNNNNNDSNNNNNTKKSKINK